MIKCQERSCAGNDNVWRQTVSLMVNSPISTKPMHDFAFGCDIREVIDQAVIRLTQMDALIRASKKHQDCLDQIGSFFSTWTDFSHVPAHAFPQRKNLVALLCHHG